MEHILPHLLRLHKHSVHSTIDTRRNCRVSVIPQTTDSKRVLRLSGFTALQLPSNHRWFSTIYGLTVSPFRVWQAEVVTSQQKLEDGSLKHSRWFREDRETMGFEYQRNVKLVITSLLLLLPLGRWPGRLTYRSHGCRWLLLGLLFAAYKGEP